MKNMANCSECRMLKVELVSFKQTVVKYFDKLFYRFDQQDERISKLTDQLLGSLQFSIDDQNGSTSGGHQFFTDLLHSDGHHHQGHDADGFNDSSGGVVWESQTHESPESNDLDNQVVFHGNGNDQDQFQAAMVAKPEDFSSHLVGLGGVCQVSPPAAGKPFVQVDEETGEIFDPQQLAVHFSGLDEDEQDLADHPDVMDSGEENVDWQVAKVEPVPSTSDDDSCNAVGAESDAKDDGLPVSRSSTSLHRPSPAAIDEHVRSMVTAGPSGSMRRRFECTECFHAFCSMSSFRHHFKSTHMGRLFMCEKPGCNFRAVKRYLVGNHIMRTHPIQAKGLLARIKEVYGVQR